MHAGDLVAVSAIAAQVHGPYPEDDAVFAERLLRHPAGCRVLAGADAIFGYVLSHPWEAMNPPSLNTLLGVLPPAPGTYYLHDVALLPAARGHGAGAELVAYLEAQGGVAGAASLSLVAVHASTAYWRRQGFEVVASPALAVRLASYGADACYMVKALGRGQK